MSLLNPFEDFLISASQKVKNISFYSGGSEINGYVGGLFPPTFTTDEIFQIRYSHSGLLTTESRITFECKFKDIFGHQFEDNCFAIYVKPDLMIFIYPDDRGCGPIDIRKDKERYDIAVKRLK